MDLIDFSTWSRDALTAYAVVATLTLIVAAITVFFRELGATSRPDRQAGKRGRFGYPRAHGAKTKMRVLQIRQLAADVKSFRLLPLDGYLDYEPGQFLTFHFGETRVLSRCYSLNSSPSRPGVYEVTVKLLAGGKGSGWMHNQVAVGDELTVTPPAGRFVLRSEAAEIVLVAGGIGVTPCISMLTYLIDGASSQKVTFFYAARTMADLVFRDEIEALTSRSPNAAFIPILSRPDDDWAGACGHLDAAMMRASGIDFTAAEVYTCGPEGLMATVKEIAVANGTPVERFHQELFASIDGSDVTPRQATITVNGDQKLAYDGNDNLLDFLNNHDVIVPCSCRAGVCGTCEVRILDGDTESLTSEYLSEKDLAAGCRLACITYPKSDVTIET